MWSGLTAKLVPFSRSTPSMVSCPVPMPEIRAPMAFSKPHRSCTWGSAAAFRSRVVPGARTAAMIAFSVAVTLGSSRNTSPARGLPRMTN